MLMTNVDNKYRFCNYAKWMPNVKSLSLISEKANKTIRQWGHNYLMAIDR